MHLAYALNSTTTERKRKCNKNNNNLAKNEESKEEEEEKKRWKMQQKKVKWIESQTHSTLELSMSQTFYFLQFFFHWCSARKVNARRLDLYGFHLLKFFFFTFFAFLGYKKERKKADLTFAYCSSRFTIFFSNPLFLFTCLNSHLIHSFSLFCMHSVLAHACAGTHTHTYTHANILNDGIIKRTY